MFLIKELTIIRTRITVLENSDFPEVHGHWLNISCHNISLTLCFSCIEMCLFWPKSFVIKFHLLIFHFLLTTMILPEKLSEYYVVFPNANYISQKCSTGVAFCCWIFSLWRLIELPYWWNWSSFMIFLGILPRKVKTIIFACWGACEYVHEVRMSMWRENVYMR